MVKMIFMPLLLVIVIFSIVSVFPTFPRSGICQEPAESRPRVSKKGSRLPSCGLQGNIESRLHDCSRHRESRKPHWALITRTADGIEIWQDFNSKLLWSDPLNGLFQYRKAKKACRLDSPQTAPLSSLKWRLPTIDDYLAAQKESAMSSQLSMMTKIFWSASWHYGFSRFPWIFNGELGQLGSGAIDDALSIRCIAEPH
ncbi:MAG: hypothetical protein RJB38_1819 [Pseudomonadota bacterium]|jgi:hypothetical protein